MTDIVHLTSCEVWVAKRIAALREQNDDGWDERHQARDESGISISTRGMLGEFAFCKLVRAWPDLGWLKAEKADLRYNGRTVDVKCSRKDSWLNVAHHKGESAPVDVFVAMQQIDERQYRYLGWQFADMVMQPEWEHDTGNGPYYAYPVSGLQERLWM